MTCKDCYHYDACKSQVKVKYQDATDTIVENLANGETNCNRFKDKSKIFELPCNVGASLYDILFGYVREFVVIGFSLIETHLLVVLRGTDYKIPIMDIGKSAFLSKTEAEKALEEMKDA